MSLSEEARKCIHAAVQEANACTRNEIFDLFGLTDDEDGRKTFRVLGDFASMWRDMRVEARKQGIRGTIKGLFGLLKLLILGACAYAAFKMGWLGK